jgi:iron(III) transport system substrate-binding protein
MHRQDRRSHEGALHQAAGQQLALAATLFAGAANAETLTLYTSQPEADAARTVDAFKKAQPGIDVTIYRSGTSDIL